MTTEPLSITLADGRRLAWAEFGAPAGTPLVILHGSPGGRLHSSMFDAPAKAAGVRVIATDRPGYGYSDPHAGLSFEDYVGDVRQLLDHLHLSRVVLAGVSGGGGFALACARHLADRMLQVVLVCGMAPAAAHLRKTMSLQVRLLLWLAAQAPRLAALVMRPAYMQDPDNPAMQRMLARMPAPDRRVLERPEARQLLLGAAHRDALRQGLTAIVHELGLYGRPLGFDPAQIRVPVHLIHGELDINVPLPIARHLAGVIPGATLEVVPGAGHLFMLEASERLLGRINTSV